MSLAPSKSNILSPHTTAPQIEDHWPTVFLPSDVAPYLKAGRYKLNHVSWAQSMVERLKQEADEALECVPQLPFAAAGARYAYHSPVTGAALKFNAQHEDRYLDPTNDAWENEEPQRRAWTLLAHWRTLCLMRNFALLAQLQGKDRLLAWPLGGVKLLRDYTQFFQIEEPWADAPYSPLYGSVTDDAAMLMLLANFHSLAADSELYQTDYRGACQEAAGVLAMSLLRLADEPGEADELMLLYAAAGLRIAGAALEVSEWVAAAEHQLGGLRTIMRRCLSRLSDGTTDGFLRGGSLLQHLIAMPALLAYYVEEDAAGGIDDPTMELDMLLVMQAPLTLSDQDLGLPAYGRYGAPGTFNLRGMQSIYELAATRLGADIYGPVLSAIVNANDGARQLWGVVVGPNDLPEPDGLANGPSLLTANRLLVLRGPAANAPTVMVVGGKNEGPMAHQDWGGVFIHCGGRPLSPDPGDPGTHTPEEGAAYFASPLAHNTLLLDDEPFPGEVGMGWLPDTQPPLATLQRAAGSGLAERRVLYDAPFVVVIDSFSLTRPDILGWTYQASGKFRAPDWSIRETAPEKPAPPPETGPWAALTARRYATAPAGSIQRVHWECTAGWTLAAHILSDQELAAIIANVPGNPSQTRCDVLVLRTRARSWRLVTVFEPYRQDPQLDSYTYDSSNATVTLTLKDGETRELMIPPDTDD